MLQLLRSNSPYAVLVLAILTLLLKLQALAHPVLPVADAHQALFGWILWLLSGVFGKSAAAFCLFAVLNCFLQAIYLRGIAGHHRLFARHGYLPSFAYIVLSSLHPAMGQFSVALLMNWLLLGALDALLRFGRREEPNRVIFNAGFLLGCLALLHFQALALVLLLPLALLWLRSFRPGEWIVGFLGGLTPFYFALGLLYLADELPLAVAWPRWAWTFAAVKRPDAYLIVLLAVLLLLMIAGVSALLKANFRMTVSTRRGWGVLGFSLAFTVVMCSISARVGPAMWLCAMPPLALFVVPTMQADGALARSGSRRFANFAFYLLIALVVFCQLALRA